MKQTDPYLVRQKRYQVMISLAQKIGSEKIKRREEKRREEKRSLIF